MKAAEGYALRTTGRPGGLGVKVAVLDTRIDHGHPDLEVARRFAFRDQYDRHPGDHGTHVAGTTARRDGEGVHGVAYNADLMGISVMDPDGTAIDRFPYIQPNTDVASAIASAAGLDRTYIDRSPHTGRPIGSKRSNPAASSQIVNMSFRSPDPYGDIRTAMRDAAGTGDHAAAFSAETISASRSADTAASRRTVTLSRTTSRRAPLASATPVPSPRTTRGAKSTPASNAGKTRRPSRALRRHSRQMVRPKIVTPGHRAHPHARLKRLSNNPRLQLTGLEPTRLRPGERREKTAVSMLPGWVAALRTGQGRFRPSSTDKCGTGLSLRQ